MSDRASPLPAAVARAISDELLALAKRADAVGLRDLADRCHAARLQADRETGRDSYGYRDPPVRDRR